MYMYYGSLKCIRFEWQRSKSLCKSENGSDSDQSQKYGRI
jgi:hypothetical protein